MTIRQIEDILNRTVKYIHIRSHTPGNVIWSIMTGRGKEYQWQMSIDILLKMSPRLRSSFARGDNYHKLAVLLEPRQRIPAVADFLSRVIRRPSNADKSEDILYGAHPVSLGTDEPGLESSLPCQVIVGEQVRVGPGGNIQHGLFRQLIMESLVIGISDKDDSPSVLYTDDVPSYGTTQGRQPVLLVGCEKDEDSPRGDFFRQDAADERK